MTDHVKITGWQRQCFVMQDESETDTKVRYIIADDEFLFYDCHLEIFTEHWLLNMKNINEER
jgi:hypothetical protein